MQKDDILLELIYMPVNDSTVLMSPIQIMKSMFLIKEELGLPDSEFYKFVPYLYGPCSFEIYSSLLKLEKEGLIDTVPSSSHWKYYRVTEKGREYVEKIIQETDKEILQKLSKIKKLVVSKSFIDLLEYIYSKYPEYAKNSIINTEVFKE